MSQSLIWSDETTYCPNPRSAADLGSRCNDGSWWVWRKVGEGCFAGMHFFSKRLFPLWKTNTGLKNLMGDDSWFFSVTSLHITPKKGSQNIREVKQFRKRIPRSVEVHWTVHGTQMIEAQPIEEPRQVIPWDPPMPGRAGPRAQRCMVCQSSAAGRVVAVTPRSLQRCAQHDRCDRPCLFLWTSQGCPEGEECSWAEPSMVERQDT